MPNNPSRISFTLIIDDVFFEKTNNDNESQTESKIKFWSTVCTVKSEEVKREIPEFEENVKQYFGSYLFTAVDRYLTTVGAILNKKTEAPKTYKLKDSVKFKVTEVSYGSLILNISVENVDDLVESVVGGFSLLVCIIEACAPIALSDSIPSIISTNSKAQIKDTEDLELAFSDYNKKQNMVTPPKTTAQTNALSEPPSQQPIKPYNLDTFIRPIKNPYIAIFIPVLLSIYLLHLTLERLDTERLAIEQRLQRIEQRESAYLDRINVLLDRTTNKPAHKQNNEETKTTE
nr:hypothetical protein [uncultured Pseudomonas sp.]